MPPKKATSCAPTAPMGLSLPAYASPDRKPRRNGRNVSSKLGYWWSLLISWILVFFSLACLYPEHYAKQLQVQGNSPKIPTGICAKLRAIATGWIINWLAETPKVIDDKLVYILQGLLLFSWVTLAVINMCNKRPRIAIGTLSCLFCAYVASSWDEATTEYRLPIYMVAIILPTAIATISELPGWSGAKQKSPRESSQNKVKDEPRPSPQKQTSKMAE